MRYFKNMIQGGVIAAQVAPTGAWWREATVQEYNAYRAYVARQMANLEAAVTAMRSVTTR